MQKISFSVNNEEYQYALRRLNDCKIRLYCFECPNLPNCRKKLYGFAKKAFLEELKNGK